MKAIFAALLLAGCSKEKPSAVQTTPVAVAPATGVAAPMMASAAAKITGAFGYSLVEKMPETIQATKDDDGAGIGVLVETTNFPPFDTIIVSALVDRRIYSISAIYHGDNWSEIKAGIVSRLEAKYGAGRHSPPNIGLPSIEWGDDERSISLVQESLLYFDKPLSNEHSKAVKAAKAALVTDKL